MSDYQLLKNDSAAWMAIISTPFFERIFLEYVDIVATFIPIQTESRTLNLHDTRDWQCVNAVTKKKRIL
jgi:hypothetical protein